MCSFYQTHLYCGKHNTFVAVHRKLAKLLAFPLLHNSTPEILVNAITFSLSNTQHTTVYCPPETQYKLFEGQQKHSNTNQAAAK